MSANETRVERIVDPDTGQLVEVAWDRAETEPCEKNTPGCCVRHPSGPETACQTW